MRKSCQRKPHMDGTCFLLFNSDIYVVFPPKCHNPCSVWGRPRRWQGDPHHALRVKTAELMLSAPEGAPLEQSVAATIKEPPRAGAHYGCGQLSSRENMGFPLAIKRGNGTSPYKWRFNGKIIYTRWIFHCRFSLVMA